MPLFFLPKMLLRVQLFIYFFSVIVYDKEKHQEVIL